MLQLTKLSNAELTRLIKDAQELLAERERKASVIAEARRQVEEVARQHGFDLATLLKDGPAGPAAEALFGKKTRAKPAPKYRNPNPPYQTWAGRGQKPSWMMAAMAKNPNLTMADFAVINVLSGQPQR